MGKEKTANLKKEEKEKKNVKPKPQPAKKAAPKKKGGSLLTYFKDVRQELKKVSWPNRQEVYQSTLLVLLVVGFFIIYVGIIDQILVQVIKVLTASLTGGQ